ncbi:MULTISPECIES: DUF4190 domain-containing protein [unclassified Brevibacterium]|uniref:DUF4190 domain-containing protein n=1 Tax=unclassified Brevibacterium TaxID=2614124 RepID=UPI0010F6B318|nr:MULTISPECIES: DUF4190 domain-containing protein [unclassified Brevibacterium]MCM1011617.1 DUF4190 domain-containing protein [Brevibacterium sp. XM4083]
MSSQNNWNNPDMYYQQPQSGQPSNSYDPNGYQAANNQQVANYGSAYGPASYGSAGVGYQQLAPTNTLAIIALVASIFGTISGVFLAGIAGIVMGHIARKQIRERGERGDGMAIAALWVGYIGTSLWILFWIVYILFFVAILGVGFLGSAGSYS